MIGLIINFLLGISTLLGVQKTPNELSYWKQEEDWKQVEEHFEYSAVSSVIPVMCKNDPRSFVQFPQIIHGVHNIYLDDKIIYTSGDSTFKIASPFYQHPEISCELIKDGKTIKWKVFSYSKYFSRFKYFPRIESNTSPARFFDINLNIIAAGALILICFFSQYIFSKRMNQKIVNGLILGAISFAAYFAMATTTEFSLSISMLTAHKIGDCGVLMGGASYFFVLNQFNYFRKKLLVIINSLLAACAVFILTGKNGDIVQFGTTMALPIISFGLSTVGYFSLKETFKNRSNRQAWLGFASTMSFVIAAGSDAVHIFGITDGFMILPLGAVGGVFLLALSANQQIEKTYNERDELLRSLETKVAEKTKDLSTALEDLKRSQADLVQSAKLASLGTLSAGVAHEINNSINFVNGAIAPLEKKVMKLIPENEKPSLEKLFAAIRHGTDLTVQIVRSLRSFTGLNQAAFRDVSINEIVDSVATILKSKLNGIEFIKEIEDSLSLQASQVGLSQVVMNLISNAIDVLPKNEGKITVKAGLQGDNICLEISDNGCGMSPEIRDRIFDPFFTTKDVGKGTGLGLFIVKKEVDRHQGKISVISELNQGTTFKIILPLTVKEEASYTDNRSAA